MAITFSNTTWTYDAATDTDTTPVTVTLSGNAMQVKGDPEVYRTLALIESEAPTLFYAPGTYGDDAPGVGWTVTWADVQYTVRSVETLAPDGVVITARIVIGR